ncbi:MAG: hypothetical protein R3Y54_05760 [Eubacteriales bacterium]
MAFQFVHGTQYLEKISTNNTIMRKVILAYYKPIVQKEVELSNTHHSNQILCVGGGYFPCTAILFHQLTGAKVTVIDNDQNAINVSANLISDMHLSEYISVQYSDGSFVDTRDYDIIHIAMQVSPKEFVFSHTHETMSDHAKILIRTPKSHLARGYQPFQEIRKHMASVRQPSFSNIERTCLYVK